MFSVAAEPQHTTFYGVQKEISWRFFEMIDMTTNQMCLVEQTVPSCVAHAFNLCIVSWSALQIDSVEP